MTQAIAYKQWAKEGPLSKAEVFGEFIPRPTTQDLKRHKGQKKEPRGVEVQILVRGRQKTGNDGNVGKTDTTSPIPGLS